MKRNRDLLNRIVRYYSAMKEETFVISHYIAQAERDFQQAMAVEDIGDYTVLVFRENNFEPNGYYAEMFINEDPTCKIIFPETYEAIGRPYPTIPDTFKACREYQDYVRSRRV